MNRAAKIQDAIDALPHATGGEWGIDGYGCNSVWAKLNLVYCVSEQMLDGRDGPVLPKTQQAANATLIAASKDLAEEVVRLRGLVKEAYLDGQRSIQDSIP